MVKRGIDSEKDALKKEEKIVMYRINCSDCDKVYIGQSKGLIATRFQEHVKEAGCGKRRGANTIRSAAATHIMEEG